MKIIIVESPSKSKTIGTYLGKGYKVLSSKGHICDLSKTGKGGLGIDIENGFEPKYIINKDKEDLVRYLKSECEGKEVYLATDPDREGEAIAYHLARELGLSYNDENRIEFHEITKSAVNEAIQNPHKIDLQMVDSQETRRMIDRILGFDLSKLMQRKINSKSAGRVQSAALLIVAEREKEIISFVPEAYYDLDIEYKGNKIKLNSIGGNIVDYDHRIKDRSILENLVPTLKEFVVTDIEKKMTKRQSYPTFTTSTLQQDSANKLGISPTKCMQIAQKLYEGKDLGSESVGLITYMRTDSTRLADSFVSEALKFIEENYGKEYVGKLKVKGQKNMQDAHEGIRPTSIRRTPESIKQYLTSDEYKIYKLIYNRTIASLMSNAIYDTTKILLDNTNSKYQMTGSVLKFDGYQKVYKREDNDDKLPKLEVGDSFNADKIEILDKQTEPKSRYTEAALIKEMEDLGIGRPSTYAQTVYTLKDRKYCELKNKTLYPTEQGMLTADSLGKYFSDIINVKYTANMEADLDKIAKGEKNKLDELNEFYNYFMPILDEAKNTMQNKYPIPTDEICPECGKNLVIRLGKFGEFMACSNYPYCSYIKKEEKEVVDTGFVCPVCGKGHLVERESARGKSKGSKFYGCSNYPKCKTVLPGKPISLIDDETVLIDVNGSESKYNFIKKMYVTDETINNVNTNEDTEEIKCPKCNKGILVKRIALKGKNKGNEFYACNQFPKCKNILSIEEYNKLKNINK
ncbi:MAG: type I DNA topoisomerase [Acholeplasmatales bacterium]|nr:type I DNA topoisomerase [Acholeplasmatales bacterium]